jgi:hypothetical protein
MNKHFSRLVNVTALFIFFNLSFVVTDTQTNSMDIAALKKVSANQACKLNGDINDD